MSRIATRWVRRRLVFQRPVRTTRGEFVARESLLVELRDADGLRGLGEAAPWPGFGDDDLDAIELALRGALERLERVDARLDSAMIPDDVAAMLERYPTARAALEGARCDLAARRIDVPLADWLARRTAPDARPASEHVASGALLLGRTPEAVYDEAAQVRASGYAAAKIKLGGVPLEVDIARVRSARAGLGESLRLRGDANGAWHRAEAVTALEALAPFALEYVEQPVAAEDFEGLAALRAGSPVRIAADESIASEHGLRAVIKQRAADVVVLKPTLLGGPLRALALATEARAAGLETVFTHALDSAVGAWHAVHCAAAWADPAAVHGLGTAGLFTTDVGPAVDVTRGVVTLPGRPGLGFDSWD